MSKHGCGSFSKPDKPESEKTNEDYVLLIDVAVKVTKQGVEDSYKKALNSLDKKLVIKIFDKIREAGNAGESSVYLKGLNDLGEEAEENTFSDEVTKNIQEVLRHLDYNINDFGGFSVSWAYLC